jgi:hypothetical protein
MSDDPSPPQAAPKPALDLEPAIRRTSVFLERSGDAVAIAVAKALLDDRERLAAADAVEASLRADGAAAAEGAESEAALRATVRTLRWLDIVHLLGHPAAESAAGFVASQQAEDGGFGSGGEDERIAATGEATGVLARTPFARRTLLDAASRWLTQHWSVERVQGPSYGPILAYFHVLANLQSDLADEALQWCGRELERGFRMGVIGPLAVARVFVRCGARALPGSRLAPLEVLAALCASQREDGSFPDAGDDPVDAALEALVALIGLSE